MFSTRRTNPTAAVSRPVCREAGCDPEQEADPDGEFSDVLQSPEKSPVG